MTFVALEARHAVLLDVAMIMACVAAVVVAQQIVNAAAAVVAQEIVNAVLAASTAARLNPLVATEVAVTQEKSAAIMDAAQSDLNAVVNFAVCQGQSVAMVNGVAKLLRDAV